MEDWLGDWFGPWWDDADTGNDPPAGATSIRFRGTVQEMLEAAALLCCCGSGSGSGGGPRYTWGCCPGRDFPATIHATHTGTVALNGSWALTYSDTVPASWPGGGGPLPGYYSEPIYQFTCPVAVDYYSMLRWDHVSCTYTWQQATKSGGVWGGTAGTLEAGYALPAPCVFSFTCDPFYLRAGMTITLPTSTPRVDCTLGPGEPRHTCAGGTGSPVVEITE